MATRKDETIMVDVPPPKAAGGELKRWLPLVAAVVVMPVLAYATMQYVFIPRMKASLNAQANQPPPAKSGDKVSVNPSEKINVSMSKILVNVSGSMGSRYLMTSVTLAGTRPDFEKLVEKNKPQLTDLAAGILSAKTIEDLEKPGARNTIRSELLAAFRTVLGDGAAQELYLTEFAVQ